MSLKIRRDKRPARNTHIAAKKQAPPRRRSLPLPSFESIKGTSALLLLIAVGAGLLVGLAAGSLHLYRYATTSEFFATKTINITGNVRLQREAALGLIELRPGDNSLAVSIAGMERAISKSPWVEEVAVKRVLPDRFDISLKERTPWFWVRHQGQLYYADERGLPIAPLESENFMSLPALEVQSGVEHLLPRLKDYVLSLQGNALPIEYAALSWIRLSPGKGVELYIENRGLHLSISPDAWHENIKRLGVVIGDLARRNELALVREVRAADGSVWVVRKT